MSRDEDGGRGPPYGARRPIGHRFASGRAGRARRTRSNQAPNVATAGRVRTR